MEEPTRPPTVLIANDQEWSARSLESIFAAEGYGVLRAFTGAQAIQRAESALPDVIILDRQMPDLDGAEVCRRLRSDPRIGSSTPILITTAGQAGRVQRLEAFEAGAWDFIGQPIDGEILLHKVRTFLQARQAVESASSEGLVDSATGLYSRRGLHRRAREIASDARRRHEPLACIVFATETPALAAALVTAEELAQDVARAFRSSGRTSDAVARLGPLEFAIMAPGTTAEGATRMIERIEAAIGLPGESADPNRGRIELRAGYCTIADFSATPLEPVEMIERAGVSLRNSPRPAAPTLPQ